jgi:hypothetical protein
MNENEKEQDTEVLLQYYKTQEAFYRLAVLMLTVVAVILLMSL